MFYHILLFMFSFVLYDKFGAVKANSPSKTINTSVLKFAKYTKSGELSVTGSTGAGSAVSTGTFNLDFGNGESYVTVVVTQPLVNGSTDSIVFTPVTRGEDFAIENINLTVLSVTASSGFTVLGYAPTSSNGAYTIKYTLIN